MKREKASIGVLIILAGPTEPMLTEAVKKGFYESLYGRYPRIQILTMEKLLSAKRPCIPIIDPSVFKKAAREITSKQQELRFCCYIMTVRVESRKRRGPPNVADCSAINKFRWRPTQGQIIWAYEEPEEQLTSTLWDESDPYLLGLWQQGKVFASRAEAMAAQAQEQPRRVTDFSKMRISELIAFAETRAQIEQENPLPDDPDRDASWTDTLEALRLMKERGVPEALRDE